jgi:hypothetical protein
VHKNTNSRTFNSCQQWGSQRVTPSDPNLPPALKPGDSHSPGFSFSFFPTTAAAISSLQGKLKVHYSQQTSTHSNTFAGTYFVSTIYIILELVLDYFTVLRSRTSEIITSCGTKQKLIRGLAHGN